MSLKYKSVVPWGRSLDEYKRMFDLTEDELTLRIVGCGDGPASFNIECNSNGGQVVSIDPLYQLSKVEIKKRIDETYDDVLRQTAANKEKFVWDTITSVEDLGRIRMEAMNRFLESYEEGKTNQNYIPAMLPSLPFAAKTFDLALSSHFLFLYSDNLTYKFHVESITEMLRVAKEVRIFPLLDVNGKKSPYLEKILIEFQEKELEIRSVDYEFQRYGNEVLMIRNPSAISGRESPSK